MYAIVSFAFLHQMLIISLPCGMFCPTHEVNWFIPWLYTPCPQVGLGVVLCVLLWLLGEEEMPRVDGVLGVVRAWVCAYSVGM